MTNTDHSLETLLTRDLDGVAIKHFDTAAVFYEAAQSGNFTKAEKIRRLELIKLSVLYGHLAPSRAFARAIMFESERRNYLFLRWERIILALSSAAIGALSAWLLKN